MKTTNKNIARWWEKEKWQKKKTYIGQTTYEWRCGSKAQISEISTAQAICDSIK